jgi:hypothetical protein
MLKRFKPGKISIVVFLTALIWVWADLSQDDRLPLTDVKIEVAKSGDPALWVNFVVDRADPNLQDSVTLNTVVLKGPASRIAEVTRRRNRGDLDFNLFLVPEREGLTQTQTQTLDVLEFLRKNEDIRQLGLTVEWCEPQRLTVRARQLVPQVVPVECIGIDPSREKVNLDPSSVEAYVPTGETFRARVVLSEQDRTQARSGVIERTPFIELVRGQRQPVATKVRITLTPAATALTDFPVPATVGFCFSPNLQGRYRVRLENDPTELANVHIRASSEAHAAYSRAPFQLELYIEDRDVQAQTPIARPFVFAFPEEYVRRNEIQEARPAPTARFTLERVAEAKTEQDP